jgi:hypothetical protein
VFVGEFNAFTGRATIDAATNMTRHRAPKKFFSMGVCQNLDLMTETYITPLATRAIIDRNTPENAPTFSDQDDRLARQAILNSLLEAQLILRSQAAVV